MDKIVLISFGRGGYTAYLKPERRADGATCETRIEGYGGPDSFFRDNHRDADGALVVDVREAVGTRLGHSWVFDGPLVSTLIEDGAREVCPEPQPGFAEALVAAYPPHAYALASRKAGGLDKVSPAEYARGWKQHGARVGQVRGGEIVWEVPAPPVVDHPTPDPVQVELL